MSDSRPQHSFRTIALVALAYIVVGVGTIALARAAPSMQLRTVCRLAAWITSAAIFAAHIVHESRRGSLARRTAQRAAAAVALATLVLAASAVVRQLTTSAPRPSMLLAFAVWPVLTGGVSFLVALGAATLFARTRQHVV